MKIGRGLQALLLAGLFALAVREPPFAAEPGKPLQVERQELASDLSVVARKPSDSAPVLAVEEAIYRFCGPDGYNCTGDGQYPSAGVILDGMGNLYGTTFQGGSHQMGTLFKLAPTGASWAETILYNFCAQANCADGAEPQANLVMDAAGSIYGTTSAGGNHGGGTVFRLSPTSGGWTETVLYSFCSQTNCADGQSPVAGLLMDSMGNFYGTTSYGGSSDNRAGTVFKLSPTSTGWNETVLHSFCQDYNVAGNCVDGAVPLAGVIMDPAGSLYGTTYYGGTGTPSAGTVFRLTSTGTGWTHEILYNFCSQPNCPDGEEPQSTLIMDNAGNLYGTTVNGLHGGTVFELSPTSTGWTEAVLYYFCPQSASTCPDGASPVAGLIIDSAGDLYGTTESGGDHGLGTVFELVASDTGWAEIVL
jgi:uncharacterized repeat protein (TIGR03803 family)